MSDGGRAARTRLWDLPAGLRRALLAGPPLALAVLTVLHPQPDATTHGLLHASTWFMAYHMIQLPLVGLVAVSVVLLADEFRSANTWQTWTGIGTFLVFFSAYDTVAGIATGLAMRGARDLPADQQDAVFELVDDWPGLEPFTFWLAIVGTAGWVLAVGYLTFAARRAGASPLVWVFLGLAAFFLLLGHPAPFGTIAFGSLFVAVLAHEWQLAAGRRAVVPAGPR
jgi:hypothetical protein